jgi:hypothetical protein
MARKTVKVEIPTGSPDEMIELTEDIVEEHEDLKEASPLDDKIVQAMKQRATDAKAKRKRAADLEAEAGKLRDQADTLIGIAPGQTSETKDTLRHDVTGTRDLLLVKNRGNEEALAEWGFDVSVGTAAAPQRKPKPAAK